MCGVPLDHWTNGVYFNVLFTCGFSSLKLVLFLGKDMGFVALFQGSKISAA